MRRPVPIEIKQHLSYNYFTEIIFFQGEWYSSCLYDQVHPDDVEKVREQLSTQEPQNTGRILDLKTGTVKKEGHQCE